MSPFHHHQYRPHQHSYRLNYPGAPIPPKPHKHTRKNQAKLTKQERDRFLAALQSVISMGLFGPQVAIHAEMQHMMHSSMGPVGTQRFLPWHRVYLFELEQLLEAHDPEVAIPYWDWVSDRSIPQWLQGFTPTVLVNGNPITVVRQPGVLTPNLPTQGQLNSVQAQTVFTNFTVPPNGLEGLHNTVHVWVGGTMAQIPTAPADPLFWLHHANIDRIWSIWQKKNPNKNPSLTGLQAVMDPWTYNESDTRDTTNFGYTYA